MAVAQQSMLQTSLQMEPGIERPQSALARGVQITEFREAHVNPEPVVIEETDVLMEQFLSPRKLRLLTGVDNLDDITVLEMKVNTSDTSLGNFGQFLPNLKQLRVSNSKIPYIRDLGSSLRSLNVIWASRCCLLELDGISAMCNLREVYLSYNEMNDISPISMLEQIEILDLEGNNIDDIVQVQYLAICSKLSNLTLEGNPICVYPTAGEEESEYDYRQAVKKAIPHLKTLDDELLIEGVGSFQKHNVFDADWAYLQELQRDIGLQEDSDSAAETSRPSSGNRPSTAALKPNTSFRPGTALRPSSGFRPLTAGPRPASMGARPATAIGGRPNSSSNRPSSGGEVVETTDASDLTMGRVICGNPSKALISRRRLNPDSSGDLDTQEQDVKFEPKIMEEWRRFSHKVEHTYDPLPEETKDRNEIVDELKEWRKHHEVRMEKIRAERAPQVLVVDHDDAISLSGDSDVDTDDEEFSPLRDHQTKGDEDNEETTSNEMLLDSVSSFIPAVTNHTDTTEAVKPSISSVKSDRLSFPSKSSEQSEDSLLKASSVDDTSTFRISDFKRSARVKDVILPPSERDIVRKHTQQTVQSQQAPLVPQGYQGAIGNEARIRSPGPSLRVNVNTGLPKSQSGAPVMSRVRRSDELIRDPAQPVIRGSGYERPVPPPSQRPSTARAALGIPTMQPKMRRSLPSVPSLPSKPPVPPK